MALHNSVRIIAVFEAAKGTLVILTGVGALSLIHQDAQKYAAQLVLHLHLNPAKHYPQIFIDAITHITDTRLLTLASMAATYGLVRLVEAYGLWNARRWAEWFAAVSGGIYIPFEIYEFIKGNTWLSAGALAINALVVTLMVKELYRGHSADGIHTAQPADRTEIR